MALKNDLSGLPVAKKVIHEERPDVEPELARLLGGAWADEFTDTDEHPTDLPMAVAGARMRGSWAAMCSRLIGYRMTEVPESNPVSIADQWRFGLGHLVHDRFQALLPKIFEGEVIVEAKATLSGGLIAMHADAIATEFDFAHPLEEPNTGDVDFPVLKRTCVELKSINGFAFKKAVGAQGPAEGPRMSAKVQGALNAKANDCDDLVIIYASLENISPAVAKKQGLDEIGRFTAQWTYPREVWEPWADAEVERMETIAAIVDIGALPDRRIPDPELPDDALIVDPTKGMWTVTNPDSGVITDAGSTWHCGYCDFREQCALDLAAGH